MPGPHGFAVRNSAVRPARRFFAHRQSLPCDSIARRRCCVHRIPSRVRDDGQRPSCRERTGRAGRTDLPDGESDIFFAGRLDHPNQLEIIAINRSRRSRSLRLSRERRWVASRAGFEKSVTADSDHTLSRSGRMAAKKQPGLGTLARQVSDKSASGARSSQIFIVTTDRNSKARHAQKTLPV